jgi:hypothetical protein
MRRSRAATATRPIRNGAGIRRRGFETLLCKVKPGGHILIGSRGSCLRRRGNAVDPPLLLGRGGAPEIQGILFVWASECGYWLKIQGQIQWFTTQFPTHLNREFISP